jgi:hypothetical protein
MGFREAIFLYFFRERFPFFPIAVEQGAWHIFGIAESIQPSSICFRAINLSLEALCRSSLHGTPSAMARTESTDDRGNLVKEDGTNSLGYKTETVPCN